MDIYNLINSKAISEHCRKINHKFNTEELAVLIYRNKRMSIDEKISVYLELINNYEDMEVIERINCKHYDSVKDMIKVEITRLQDLIKILETDETNVVYTYNYYSNYNDRIVEGKNEYIDIYKTLKEVQDEIDNELKEDEENELLGFRIRKRQFAKNSKYDIVAEYLATENKELKMINIYDFNSDWLDISNIFLNIPTPFKKGDLLVSTSKKPFGEGHILNYDKYPFVLDYLVTWRENIQKLLAKGNFDSSDMQGVGYYLSDNCVIFESNHDYDSWEYFEGELQGMEKILKGISSLMKGKIGIDLFINTYEYFKVKYSNMSVLYCKTEEGLKLAGLNDEDINNIKLYTMKK